ncbi:MAG TPA: YbaK/EbsC family protein [Solirubrobacteraceae bacterium]|nr:YbaK/EbsC family protein [Solirubrobacteraceae bacterium]
MQTDEAAPPRPAAAPITAFLERSGVEYKLVEHRETWTARAEARALNYPAEQVAKTLVLRDRDGRYRLAVVPGSHRLDLDKARALFDDASDLRLATEDEMRADLPDFPPGTVPPFGALVSAPGVVDHRLLDFNRVVCPAGDHRHSVLFDAEALIQAGARVGDVCED